MSATLSEAGSDRPTRDPRLACERCKGDGFVAVPAPCDCLGSYCFCGSVDVDCPECDGIGRTTCAWCGDPAVLVHGGETFCSASCAAAGREPEDETDAPCPCGEPECSRPFGHHEEAA